MMMLGKGLKYMMLDAHVVQALIFSMLFEGNPKAFERYLVY